MVRDLAQALEVSPTVIYTFIFAGLLLAALVAGVILNRILHRWAGMGGSTWSELNLRLLGPVGLP